MLMVDVFVPVIGRTYDFSVDENVRVEAVMEEIMDLIAQKDGFTTTGSEKACLLSAETRTQLNPKKSLSENKIGNGDRLLLV